MLLPVSVLGLDKTGTRFLGGHRFEPVVFWGPQLSTCRPSKIRDNLEPLTKAYFEKRL